MLLVVVLAFFASQLSFVLLRGILDPWDAQAIDRLFRLRSASPRLAPVYDSTIVHVDLNNSTIQRLDNFYLYLNRSLYAKLVRNLSSMGAAAQVYDFVFAAPANEADDRALIDAAAESGKVYFGLALALADRPAAGSGEAPKRSGDDETLQYLDATAYHSREAGGRGEFLPTGADPLITFPALAWRSKGLGYLSLRKDPDGVYRRIPLIARWGEGFYPSLSLRVACDYLGVTPDRVIIEPGAAITLKGAARPGGRPHDIVIPIDEYGGMVIDFVGPWERMRHYSFGDVLRASDERDDLEAWGEELRGKIVIVSDVSTGGSDIGSVPTDVNFPLSGLHANAIHTILTEQFLKEFSSGAMVAVEAALSVMVAIFSLTLSSLLFSAGMAAATVGYIGIAAAAFFYGHTILHIVHPLILLVFSTLAVTAYRYTKEEKRRLVLRKTFEAYFPPSVVRKILENPGRIALAGQRKELTILFSDIKSFTTFSAELAPDRIQKLLNEYFDAMVEIVFRHHGTVDKYMGDGLMVFFGDPEPLPDHAERCVRAAVDMQKKVREIREKWEKEGGFPIRIRIGINTGEVVVGNMGSARRLSYTVLGAAVNLAQRLEANAPVDGIMISRRTRDLVGDRVPTRSLGEIKVKGIDEPVSVYEVVVEEQ